MKVLLFIFLAATIAANDVHDELRVTYAETLTGQALVDYLNENQQLFKAKLSTAFSRLTSDARSTPGSGVAPSMEALSAEIDEIGRITHSVRAGEIPAFFDARRSWPQCGDIIGTIRDQSACGSCWATCAGEIISDRICIASGGARRVSISTYDFMSCCGTLCENERICSGGNPIGAMQWWVSHGVVTGSNYAGCLPYPFPPCEHHTDNVRFRNCDDMPDFKFPPTCIKRCQAGYPLAYWQDKHYGKSVYGLTRWVANIQKEIMTNGPIIAMFNLYEDFQQYSFGIYAHRAGEYLGRHSVKVIGWGTEHGVDYWLCCNSWNTDWGEDGLFRIIRGTNDCEFEGQMIAGVPE